LSKEKRRAFAKISWEGEKFKKRQGDNLKGFIKHGQKDDFCAG
jgi:hypothetical protein